MLHPPMFQRVHAEAKRLHKSVKNCDPAALKVIRAAYPTAAPQVDSDLSTWANLQRVQHAYAIQQGCSQWSDLLQKTSDSWADLMVADETGDLTETDEFGSALAGTNACNFIVDDYTIEKVTVDQDDPKVVRIAINWSASGEQIEDKPFCGDVIQGSAVLVVDGDHRQWDEVVAGVEDSWHGPDE